MVYLPYFLFTAFILYVFFGAYVYRLNPRGLSNKLFFLICGCYAVWSFAYTNLHSVELKEDVWFWYRFSLPARIFYSMLIVHFFLSFTGKRNSLKYPAYLLYAPGFIFLGWSYASDGPGVSYFSRTGALWLEGYELASPANALFYSWHALLMLSSLALIIEWKRKSASQGEKKQAAAVLAAGVPAVILTLASQIFYLMRRTPFPNLAPAAGMIWIGGIRYAIARHGFLKITPEIAFDSILKSMSEGLVLTDAAGKVKWTNSSALKITGFGRKEILNAGIGLLFENKDEPASFFSSGESVVQRDSIFVSKTGTRISVLLSVSEVLKGDMLAGYVFSFQDITERKKAEEKIRYIGFHDKLTGLYNRAFAEEEMRRMDTPRQLPLGVIICDVNGLKLVNDFYGHIAGDRLIMNAAKCVQSSCRQEDVISRWGGDEFIIFLPQTSCLQVKQIADRIRQNAKKSEIAPVRLSLSVGTAVKDEPGADINKIIKKADDMMYNEKLRKLRGKRPGGEKNRVFKHILIVEDEEDFSSALTLRLSSCGYRVRTASSAGEGVALARETHPDLIIMDVMFSGKMDGYSATKLIKNAASPRKVPVIMVSAKTLDEDIKTGLESGADFYLTKPLDGRQLLESIEFLERNPA